jgi:citrate lyase subunit beta / citryl-CoA lyase
MRLRSLLFVPGDRPERMEKALAVGADALILDLEDAVATDARPKARSDIAAFLARADRRVPLFVRVNPLDGDDTDRDLDAIAGGRPDAIVFPKAEGAASIEALVARMAGCGLQAPVLPIATETPVAIFELGSYRNAARHLVGLTWGAEDLPAAIGAATSREEDGRYTPPYEMARSLTLLGAHAAGVPAIETVFPSFRDLDGLGHYVKRAARDGFTGMMAIHPAQVAVINEAFTPSPEAVAQAKAVVEAFAANPGAGALQLNGKMIDAPHLKQAQRLLAQADG